MKFNDFIKTLMYKQNKEFLRHQIFTLHHNVS